MENNLRPVRPLPREDLDDVIEATQGLVDNTRERSFFITGGTGFCGVWLLESSARANEDLDLGMTATVLARKAPHLHGRQDIRFIEDDVRSFEFPDGAFPCIIYAATEASAKLNENAPDKMFNVVVDGMPARSETHRGGSDRLHSASAYGEGKRVAEHMCAKHARRRGHRLTIARCFAFVGPRLPLDAHFAIGNLIRDALCSRPILVFGDGKAVRSHLYASDPSMWLLAILLEG